MSFTKGLVGHWPLTAARGADDVSGDAYHGTPYGGVTFGVSSPVGEGASFDGSDDDIDTGMSPADMGETFTVSAWLNLSGGGGVVGSGWNLSGNKAFTLFYTGSEIGLWVSSDGSDNHSDTAPISSGVWKHVAVTLDSTGGLEVFIDGASASSASTTITALYDSTDTVWIGNEGDSGRRFSGDASDVRIYNRVLSNVEINQLASMTAPQNWRV